MNQREKRIGESNKEVKEIEKNREERKRKKEKIIKVASNLVNSSYKYIYLLPSLF